ncbi:MAG: hypothetical protein NWP69_12890, partial [Congregibacter sp.]|nr:hypothetical protein [Congregibacter sp.]
YATLPRTRQSFWALIAFSRAAQRSCSLSGGDFGGSIRGRLSVGEVVEHAAIKASSATIVISRGADKDADKAADKAADITPRRLAG